MALTYNCADYIAGNGYSTSGSPSYNTSTSTDHNHGYWYYNYDNHEDIHIKPEENKYEINTYWNDPNQDRIKELEKKIDLLNDVIITLVTGMDSSSFKLNGYQEAIKLCIEKLNEEIMKRNKEKSRVIPKKKHPDFLKDDDFGI